MILEGVREYEEDYAIELIPSDFNARLCIEATNEGGLNSVSVDLFDFLSCLKHEPSSNRVVGGFTLSIVGEPNEDDNTRDTAGG